jgi:hypothetical protein
MRTPLCTRLGTRRGSSSRVINIASVITIPIVNSVKNVNTEGLSDSADCRLLGANTHFMSTDSRVGLASVTEMA